MSEQIAPLRTMGFFGTALLPLNGMIGAGIFALPAVLFAAAGNFAPWLMLVGGILFLPLVFVFAWLSTHFDQSGGSVLYGKTAFGDFAGFQAGWSRYASAIVTVAANAHVMVSYIATIFPFFDGPIMRPLSVAIFIGFITIVNLFSLRVAVGTLGVLTAIKILPLLGLVIAGLVTGGVDLGIVVPEFTDTESVILLTFYAFIGFETIVLPAGEMKNPKRDIPLALVTVLAGVTLLYMLVIWAYIAISPSDLGNGDALAVAARDVMGEVGALAIVIAAAFSIGANNFGGGIALPRMTYGMAEQRMLPRWFMTVSPRLGTPVNSILFYGIASILFGLWEGFLVLALAGTLTRLLTYIISAAALPVIEHRGGKMDPLHTIVTILAIASSIWVSTQADAQSWQVFGGIFVVGSGLYFIARRQGPAT